MDTYDLEEPFSPGLRMATALELGDSIFTSDLFIPTHFKVAPGLVDSKARSYFHDAYDHGKKSGNLCQHPLMKMTSHTRHTRHWWLS